MPASSSLMRKRAAMPASKLKKLGATKLSEMDAKPDANARESGSGASLAMRTPDRRGAIADLPRASHTSHDAGGALEPTPAFEPGTPSPTVTSKRPAAASPTTPDRVQAPAAGAPPPVISRGADTKRRKRPKSSDPSMTRTSARPNHRDRGTDRATSLSPAVTLPKRDARHLPPPKTMNMAEWDDWSVSSVMDGVVGGFGLANTANTDGASRGAPERFPRETRNAGIAAASPGKASLDAFVAATGAEAVSLVGRAALALGNAVVDGIEGTADFVQHAAKQADRIASKAASPTPGGRGAIRRGSEGFPEGNAASPVRRTSGRGHDARVLGLGKTRSPLKKTGVGGGFRSPAKAAARKPRCSEAAPAGDAGDEWGWAAGSPTKDELSGAVSSAVAHYRRELDASRSETASLREELRGARSALAAAADEAEGLKRQNLGLQRRQAQRECEREGSDPLAEQVRCQLETLVAEKAKLAQENDELWRENESLQELLMHSNMATEAESLYSAGGLLADLVEKAAPPQTHFESKLAEATEGSSEISQSGSAATLKGAPEEEDERLELLDASSSPSKTPAAGLVDRVSDGKENVERRTKTAAAEPAAATKVGGGKKKKGKGKGRR